MSCDDGGAFVSGLLWLPTLNNYNSPHTIINVECGSNGSAKSTNRTSIFTQDLYCTGLQTSLAMKSMLILGVKIDGEQLSTESVQQHTWFSVTGANISVVLNCNSKPVYVILASNPAALHHQSIQGSLENSVFILAASLQGQFLVPA